MWRPLVPAEGFFLPRNSASEYRCEMTAQDTIVAPNAGDRALDAAASLEDRRMGTCMSRTQGEVTLFLRGLGSLPADQRPLAGRAGNLAQTGLQRPERSPCRARYRESRHRLVADAVDVTLPGRQTAIGAPSGLENDQRGERDLRPARVRDGLRSRSRDRSLQLRSAQHPERSPGPRCLGHDLSISTERSSSVPIPRRCKRG